MGKWHHDHRQYGIRELNLEIVVPINTSMFLSRTEFENRSMKDRKLLS